MDHYTAEKLFLERMSEVEAAAARHACLAPQPAAAAAPRLWVARRLRALADRVEGAGAIAGA